jgi:hypothetical protein
LVSASVALKAIRTGWDGMLRFAASVRIGRISANMGLRLWGSAASRDPTRRAAEELGRLLRTLFLCDYFTNPGFRRELHTLLNRGESVHQLQRAIYYGRLAPERGRRSDELVAISGSHAPLKNIVIAWNTARMQAVVERWRKVGMVVEDAWLHRLGPVHFEHINCCGTFSCLGSEVRAGIDRTGACCAPTGTWVTSRRNIRSPRYGADRARSVRRACGESPDPVRRRNGCVGRTPRRWQRAIGTCARRTAARRPGAADAGGGGSGQVNSQGAGKVCRARWTSASAARPRAALVVKERQVLHRCGGQNDAVVGVLALSSRTEVRGQLRSKPTKGHAVRERRHGCI